MDMDINIGKIKLLSLNIDYQTKFVTIFSKWKNVPNGANEKVKGIYDNSRNVVI